MNERYLRWDASAQRQLIMIWVAQQLDVTMAELEERVAELALLLPDLYSKLDKLQAKLVLALVRDLPTTTQRILALREALPSLNLSALLAQYPWMLVKLTAEDVQAALARLAAALGPQVNVERLVEAEPMFLLADIDAVLGELQRLMPGKDPVAVLLADPSGCLDMQSAGLKASLEIDDGIHAA
ncbi:ATP-dependent zinc metalloprotease FTSH mitochondrial [Chlorella sorokiniana]|uniref:ATP-dependent zinc metalloprotease FTSH mitochondrial n=1 Tax=Chlorella sorokiniana TaxID=3076 RepID=A0A2P6U369_CHLSO|nr:ATP-dependent zinc metalloprotease FTSH mitochondrial [Chlorella sorokiniana]|eukprot:PRW60757.1 ATP-dependent zinc metalloprotease FTSH mitochondrial [Chlorella sorokiniana]